MRRPHADQRESDGTSPTDTRSRHRRCSPDAGRLQRGPEQQPARGRGQERSGHNQNLRQPAGRGWRHPGIRAENGREDAYSVVCVRVLACVYACARAGVPARMHAWALACCGARAHRHTHRVARRVVCVLQHASTPDTIACALCVYVCVCVCVFICACMCLCVGLSVLWVVRVCL